MNDNDIEAIDKKINEVANDNLNGLESILLFLIVIFNL